MSIATEQPPARSVTGGCFCGAVRFTVDLPSKWCAHCHCSMCRRIHGAGYVTWVGFERSRFHITSGADQLHWYASSPAARRGSCAICRSNMLFESSRWADETHVALACLDGPIDRKPQANASYEMRVDWMPIDEALTVSKG
jgi:hypothetical protein